MFSFHIFDDFNYSEMSVAKNTVKDFDLHIQSKPSFSCSFAPQAWMLGSQIDKSTG